MLHYKTFVPYTSSIRHVCLINKTCIWQGIPLIKLISRNKLAHRANNVFRRKTRGIRKRMRIIDFFRNDYINIPGIVIRVEHDPNRSSFIALLLYKNNVCVYVLCPSGIQLGDIFINYAGLLVGYNIGDSLALSKIPVGAVIHNIEKYSGSGGILVRAAGGFGIIVRKFEFLGKAVVKLRSGVRYIISLDCRATLGMVSNKNFWLRINGKAGRRRWVGNRSVVRGVAMNPIDHPHGGGEGKKSKKADPMNIWGRVFKWRYTVQKF